MICCSINPQKIDDCVIKIKKVKEKVDIIELRFDKFLPTIKQLSMLSQLITPKLLIVTVRNIELLQSKKFLTLLSCIFNIRPPSWNIVNKAQWDFKVTNNILIDIDYIFVSYFLKLGVPARKIIASFHNYNNINISEKMVNKIINLHTGYIKIALTPTSLSDLVTLLDFSQKLYSIKAPPSKLIIVAMGKIGLISRILYKKFGSLWTYCCIEKTEETAPGQPTADELLYTYKIRDVNTKTKLYGIIGHNIEHSLSPIYYNKNFAELDMNCVYIPIDTPSIKNIRRFISRFGFAGFSVTSPYKDKLTNIITDYDYEIKKLKIVNTLIAKKSITSEQKSNIQNRGEEKLRIFGYNTDISALKDILKHQIHSNSTILILGSGAMAKVTIYTIAKFFKASKIYIYSRHNLRLPQKIDSFNIPLLTFNLKSQPGTIGNCRHKRTHYFDLLINCSKYGFDNKSNHFYEKILPFITKKTICLELNYRIKETPIISVAKKVGARFYTGTDFFFKQFQKQFQLFTNYHL